MTTNRDKLSTMLRLIEVGGGPKIEALLKSFFGKEWRNRARLPRSLTPASDMDAHAYLYAVTNNWRDGFEAKLKPEIRDATSAAFAGRNKFAHGASEVENAITLRALTGAAELLVALGCKSEAATVLELANELGMQMYAERDARPSGETPKSKNGDTNRPTLTLTSPKGSAKAPEQGDLLGGGGVSGLTPWRIACPPRDDVLEGRLNKDAFAANLAAADRGEGGETYADAISFFNATHLTHGLELVLRNAALRLTGAGGPSTIGLQTNFGGGKTHTLLSLLHLTRLSSLEGVETLGKLQNEL